MSTLSEIDKAVAAHDAWKGKLRDAIASGQSESTPDKVKMDNNCGFGKWLYERIDPSVKSTEYYNKVVNLHANFHLAAGAILQLALEGNKAKATSLMGMSSDFTKYSAALTRTLREWKEEL